MKKHDLFNFIINYRVKRIYFFNKKKNVTPPPPPRTYQTDTTRYLFGSQFLWLNIKLWARRSLIPSMSIFLFGFISSLDAIPPQVTSLNIFFILFYLLQARRIIRFTNFYEDYVFCEAFNVFINDQRWLHHSLRCSYNALTIWLDLFLLSITGLSLMLNASFWCEI